MLCTVINFDVVFSGTKAIHMSNAALQICGRAGIPSMRIKGYVWLVRVYPEGVNYRIFIRKNDYQVFG